MKFKVSAIVYMILIVLLCGCMISQDNMQKVKMETQISDLMNKLQIANDKIESLEAKIVGNNSGNVSIDVHMLPHKEGGYKMMATELVEVKGLPSTKGNTNRILNHCLVDVIITVHSDEYDLEEETREDLWALISFFSFDSVKDTIGWVPINDLMFYSEENKMLLSYPVYLAEGCVDLDTGEAVSWDEVAVEYKDNYAIVSWEGGNSHRVAPEYIVYPDPILINSEP